MRKKLLFTLCFSALLFPGQASFAQVTDTSAQWIWVGGSTAAAPVPAYGTKGNPEPAATKQPGSRTDAITWTDNDGNLWLYGGYFNNGNQYADIWKYNPAANTWTWMHGPSGHTANATAVWGGAGSEGVADPTYYPGSRSRAAWWVDSAGKLWVFGGRGNTGTANRFNDLWKYDPVANAWAWMNGAPTSYNVAGNYGTKGVAAATNQPGAHGYPASGRWIDHKNGKLYMFSGYGRAKTGGDGYLSDFWQYDMATNMWTWIGGGDTITNSIMGNYGTINVAALSNFPQPRANAAYWQDTNGIFYMFGGQTAGYYLNDMWTYNPATGMWTWVKGPSTPGSYFGVYGNRGAPDPANQPGTRTGLNTWRDVNGKLWLYGGYGLCESGALMRMNDVWRYDPVTKDWTWMFGSKTPSTTAQPGTYVAIGSPGMPGGRTEVNTWVDIAGNFWFYGGQGATNATTSSLRNDFWRVEAVLPPTPAQPGLYTAAKPGVCVGETNVTYAVPAVSGAISYEWSYTGTGGATITAATTTGPTNTLSFAGPAGSGTLSVKAVNTAGSGPSRDTSITVNALPTATSTNTGSKSVCTGDSLLLSATTSGGVTYQWKNGTTNVGTNSTYHAKTAGSYTVTVTNTATSCSATSTPPTVLTLDPLPTAAVTPTGTRAICQGDSLQLSATTASGVSYQWKNGTTNVGTNSTYYAKTGGDYTVTVTNTGTSCRATSAITTVNINTLPTVTVSPTGNQAVCQGDSLQLVATSGSGVSYEWKLGTTTVGSNSATYHASLPGSYTVKVTNTTTNCAVTSTPATTLAVNSLPVATVSVGGPAIVCAGDSVVLTAGTGTGYSYQWKEGTTNVGTGSNVYAAHTTGSYKVVVTVSGTGCKDSTSAVPVVVHNRPVVTLGPGDTSFCAGGVVTLEVQTQDTGLTYRWKNGTATIALATAYFLEINETGVYTVVVGRAQVGNCEDSTNAVTVTVHPLPTADITWDGLTLHATPGHASYQWNTGSQGIAGATDSTFQPAADGGYSVTVTDSNGCSRTSAVYNVTVGVEDIAAAGAQIKVYPNPVRGMLYISAPMQVTVTLSSMDGQVLQRSGQTDAHMLDMRSYTDGVYLLRITDGNGVLIRNEKVVKQN